MPSLRWIHSYETLKFNTPDGDLHKGQYAFYNNRWFVRLHPENNNQFTVIEGANRPSVTQGLIEVQVIPGQNMYYDEFALPDGRRYRIPSDQNKYRSLAVREARPLEKIVTDLEIVEIKKEDSKWQ